EASGVTRIFSPEDGQRMGLSGMIGAMMEACAVDLTEQPGRSSLTLEAITTGPQQSRHRALARWITALENGKTDPHLEAALKAAAKLSSAPTVGITGTGGAGKS